ncbi:hypothetical protein DFH11DRAFT_274603 [Phellopilus nigrolimitatus]|nr:hypothetical protein DFH11DRAFT_274603 [Phellopilus nigrolimitatus]
MECCYQDRETHRTSVLKELHPAMKAYHSIEDSETCIEGTRQELLEQVKCWASSDSKLFWLHGFAGSGKSAVANSVAGIFHAQKLLLGCFFCQRDDPECCDPLRLIPTLAYQLSLWHGVYRTKVLSALQARDEMGLAKGLKWQFNQLIMDPLMSLGGPTELPPKPLIIVVDALDECGDSVESRAELIQF